MQQLAPYQVSRQNLQVLIQSMFIDNHLPSCFFVIKSGVGLSNEEWKLEF